MSPKLTYLMVDSVCLAGPFIFSFHPRLAFYKEWKFFIGPVLSVAFLFILWDMYFTHNGIWGFNDQYILGYRIGNLPIEEILFFLCIPYACVFSFHCFQKLWTYQLPPHIVRFITMALSSSLLLLGLFHFEKWYTATTFIATSITLFFLIRNNVNWMSTFLFTYLFILIPFTLSNGILTGSFFNRVVVHYNSDHIIGIRLLTIPVEDTMYGMLLLLLNIAAFQWLKNRSFNINNSAKQSVQPGFSDLSTGRGSLFSHDA